MIKITPLFIPQFANLVNRKVYFALGFRFGIMILRLFVKYPQSATEMMSQGVIIP